MQQPRGPRPKLGVEPAGTEPASTRAYSAGDLIAGKYRLTSVLGEGGMGSVWLAHNVALEVDVALKLIRRDLATAESSVRLLQEARAAARLEHPAIVRVFDFGETEHTDPFIVMELLRGDSLGELLDRKGRLAANHAVRVLLPIASALAVAHDKGIVHRDLKPDNIFLAKTDLGGIQPKIVDFGIAKFKREPAARHTTQAGVVLGSPDYMSPEQARGRDDVDDATDVWALAVVLYEAVTGHRPFGGDNYNEQISAILLDDPEPITEFSAGDGELWQLLQRGLAKDKAARWETMRGFGRALAGWALARGITADVCGSSLVDHWSIEGDENGELLLPAGRDSSSLALRASLSSIPPSPSNPLATPAMRDSLTNELHAAMPTIPPAASAERRPTPTEEGDSLVVPPRRRAIAFAVALTVVAGGALATVGYGPRLRAAAPWLPMPIGGGADGEQSLPPSTAEPEPLLGAAPPPPVMEPTSSTPAASASTAPGTHTSSSTAALPVATGARPPPPRAGSPPARAVSTRSEQASPAPPKHRDGSTPSTDPASKLKNPFE